MSFGNLLQGLILLSKAPSTTPCLHVRLWRGGINGRSWRCFDYTRTEEARRYLCSWGVQYHLIRCRHVLLTANVTCRLGEGRCPGSAAPLLFATARQRLWWPYSPMQNGKKAPGDLGPSVYIGACNSHPAQRGQKKAAAPSAFPISPPPPPYMKMPSCWATEWMQL